MEVEVREAGPRDSTAQLVNITPGNSGTDGPAVVVRAEEVLLVVLVLILWVAAIALFFNRWGKIRMLEPYQPKFQQSHRGSCPLAPLSPPGITPQQRMSFSKYNVSCLNDTLYPSVTSPNVIKRPRQNSVFVGSSAMLFLNPPRRVKSAVDIHHLVVNEQSAPQLSKSMLPIISTIRDRKPSITVERPNITNRRRPSAMIDRPMLAHHYYPRNRRPSCYPDKPLMGRHRNFISFDQPSYIIDRRVSVALDRPSCIVHQPTLNLQAPRESLEKPFLLVEPPSTSQEYPPISINEEPTIPFKKTSHSLEQPTTSPENTTPPRMSVSLDMNTISHSRRSSVTESDRASPISIMLEDVKITAPLLESLKSSDV